MNYKFMILSLGLLAMAVGFGCGTEDDKDTISASCVGDFEGGYKSCFEYVNHGEPSEGFLQKDCEQTDQGGATAQITGVWTEDATCDTSGAVSKCTNSSHGELTWFTYSSELDASLKPHCDGTYTAL